MQRKYERIYCLESGSVAVGMCPSSAGPADDLGVPGAPGLPPAGVCTPVLASAGPPPPPPNNGFFWSRP